MLVLKLSSYQKLLEPRARMVSSKNWMKVKKNLRTEPWVCHQGEGDPEETWERRGAPEVEGKPGMWGHRSQVREFVAEDYSLQ